MEKRRLKPEEWALVKRRWEGAAEEGFDWLAAEIRNNWQVDITRQGVAVRAQRETWAKGGEASEPLAAVAQQSNKAGKATKQQAPVVAQQAAPAKRPSKAQQTDPEQPKPKPAQAGRVKAEDTGLTAQTEEFAVLIAKGMNQSEAYRQAFPRSKDWTPGSVATEASLLIGKPEVRQRVQDLMAQAAAANGADVSLVLREYLARLNADPRELTEIRVIPCRYCFGKGNRYQFTEGELEDARETHEAKRQARIDAELSDIGEFNEKGGGGYVAKGDPNPECPTCGGTGANRVMLKDSRTYSPAALALFGGVKQTKEGIEVKVVDRTDALAQVARHVGFLNEQPAVTVNMSVSTVELDAIYVEAMEKSKQAGMLARSRMARIGVHREEGEGQ